MTTPPPTSDSVPEDEFSGRPELVQRRTRMILWQRLGIAAVAIFMVFVTSALVLDAYVAANQRDYLIDCTTPKGECFKESNKRTAMVVASIIKEGADENVTTRQWVVATEYCGDKLGGSSTIDELTNCVASRVRE